MPLTAAKLVLTAAAAVARSVARSASGSTASTSDRTSVVSLSPGMSPYLHTAQPGEFAVPRQHGEHGVQCMWQMSQEPTYRDGQHRNAGALAIDQ